MGRWTATRRAVTSLGGVTPDPGHACLEHLPGEAGTPTRHQPPLRLVRREERELEESWSQKECTEGTPVGDRVLKQMTEQARVANVEAFRGALVADPKPPPPAQPGRGALDGPSTRADDHGVHAAQQGHELPGVSHRLVPVAVV